ncbi:hypothetical protein [Nocardiopsis metallicus]|uniref:Transposase-like protein n=1 Tax=Nocardiopsis metallicus TaxID=179819 RepID=A0A840W2A1_9ACTN|nr:hypothetical protein [Nocardiopsis metallicus]MBB5490959.1 transposase-like protein [Nocardiopsis metallicus]
MKDTKVPRSPRLRQRAVEAYTLYSEGVHVDVIARTFEVAQSTAYAWIDQGRALVALEKQHPGITGLVPGGHETEVVS